MEMESMEDGYVAKLLKPEGAQNITVGEVRCRLALLLIPNGSLGGCSGADSAWLLPHQQPVLIMVEDASMVAPFSSYTAASGAPAAAAPAARPAAAAPPAAAEAAPRPSPAPHTPPPSRAAAGRPGDRVFASPLARKLAAEAGLSLEQVQGTGPDGRIIRADITDALARGVTGAVATSGVAAGGLAVSPLEAFFPDYTDVSLTTIKRVTAKRLTESKQTVPHFYVSVDVRMDALLAVRQQLNDSLAASAPKGAAAAGVPPPKLSVNDWIIKAAALACMRVPEVNSSWMGDRIRRYSSVDVNVAVQTEAGLMVPIVRGAHAKGLSAIGADVKALAQKARDGKLGVEDMTGGTFTVSNLGMLGVKSFAAIVNPPQAGILAVGATRPEVRAAKGGWEQVQVMTVTLSCDHRVVDGAVGAQWLAQFKGLVEDPLHMLL